MAIEKLDARAARWPAPARWVYLSMKWSLVVLGAACLLYAWARRMGWSAAIWFLLFPLAYGIVEGLTWRYGPHDSQPPDQGPQ